MLEWHAQLSCVGVLACICLACICTRPFSLVCGLRRIPFPIAFQVFGEKYPPMVRVLSVGKDVNALLAEPKAESNFDYRHHLPSPWPCIHVALARRYLYTFEGRQTASTSVEVPRPVWVLGRGGVFQARPFACWLIPGADG